MKVIKKNQLIIYVMVLILMIAGYLNYTSNTEKQDSLQTSMQIESSNDEQLADIGDATLVNSNDITQENVVNNTNTINTINEQKNNEVALNTLNNQTNNESNNESDKNMIDNTVETNSNINNDYFIQSKLERDAMYSQMLETYKNVLNSTNSLEIQKQSATDEIQKINNIKNSIMICENLIKTKGFENNVIFVNGESINIIVGAKEISQEEIAQIQNIISREMKAQIENIHIINK